VFSYSWQQTTKLWRIKIYSRSKGGGGARLLSNAPSVSLTLEPPSSEWIFLRGRGSIYMCISTKVLVEILGFYPDPHGENNIMLFFLQNNTCGAREAVCGAHGSWHNYMRCLACCITWFVNKKPMKWSRLGRKHNYMAQLKTLQNVP